MASNNQIFISPEKNEDKTNHGWRVHPNKNISNKVEEKHFEASQEQQAISYAKDQAKRIQKTLDKKIQILKQNDNGRFSNI